jgi:hypothetical protein
MGMNSLSEVTGRPFFMQTAALIGISSTKVVIWRGVAAPSKSHKPQNCLIN